MSGNGRQAGDFGQFRGLTIGDQARFPNPFDNCRVEDAGAIFLPTLVVCAAYGLQEVVTASAVRGMRRPGVAKSVAKRSM